VSPTGDRVLVGEGLADAGAAAVLLGGEPLVESARTITPFQSVSALAWHPGGGWAALGGRGDDVLAWHVDEGRRELIRSGLGWTNALAFDPAGTRLAMSTQSKKVLVCDIATGQITATLTGNLAVISHLLWTEDGRWLVTGANDGRVQVWDPHAAALLVSMRPFKSRVSSLAIDPETGDLLVGDGERRVHRRQAASPATTR
jgi:WD40 repeat protein